MTPAFGPYVFSLTAAEFAAYARRLGRRQAGRMQIRYGLIAPLAGIAVIAVVVGVLWLARLIDARAAAATILLASIAFLCGKLLNHWQIGRAQALMAERMRGESSIYGGERRIAIDDGGVTVAAPDAESRHRWRSYDEAERADGLVLIWMGVAYALAIPERVLRGEGEAAALLAFAQAQIAAARSK